VNGKKSYFSPFFELLDTFLIRYSVYCTKDNHIFVTDTDPAGIQAYTEILAYMVKQYDMFSDT
jgi:hypothetical protein